MKLNRTDMVHIDPNPQLCMMSKLDHHQLGGSANPMTYCACALTLYGLRHQYFLISIVTCIIGCAQRPRGTYKPNGRSVISKCVMAPSSLIDTL